MQHVLLKAIDPELYRCLKRRSIEPQLYALRWMRCLFSNVLSKVNVDEDEDDEGKYKKRRRAVHRVYGKHCSYRQSYLFFSWFLF